MARPARGEDLECHVVSAGCNTVEKLGGDADGPAQVPPAGELDRRRAVAIKIWGQQLSVRLVRS